MLDTIENMHRKMKIESCVRFKEINYPLLIMFEVVAKVFSEYGLVPTITGAYGEDIYPVNGVHDRGLAIDVRTRDVDRPSVMGADIERRLKAFDKGFRVLYHDSGNGWHFHIDYQPEKSFPFKE